MTFAHKSCFHSYLQALIAPRIGLNTVDEGHAYLQDNPAPANAYTTSHVRPAPDPAVQKPRATGGCDLCKVFKGAKYLAQLIAWVSDWTLLQWQAQQ